MMDADGKTTLPRKFKGLKVSLMPVPNMPEGEAVMVVSQKDFDRLCGIEYFTKCTVKQYSSGMHCPNEGKHQIDKNTWLCDKCYENYLLRRKKKSVTQFTSDYNYLAEKC